MRDPTFYPNRLGGKKFPPERRGISRKVFLLERGGNRVFRAKRGKGIKPGKILGLWETRRCGPRGGYKTFFNPGKCDNGELFSKRGGGSLPKRVSALPKKRGGRPRRGEKLLPGGGDPSLERSNFLRGAPVLKEVFSRALWEKTHGLTAYKQSDL